MGLLIWLEGTDGTKDGTISKKEKNMDFAYFCQGLYPNIKGIDSQGMFVSKLFIAGGSKRFSDRIGSDQEYQRKLYSGRQNKRLTIELKKTFPSPVNVDAVRRFFRKYIDDDKLGDVLNYFGIPSSLREEKVLIADALATQFDLLVSSSDYEVEDIVAPEYQKLLKGEEKTDIKELAGLSPYYQGDSAVVITPEAERNHSVLLFQQLEHHWEILNDGKQTWRGRTLSFVETYKWGPKPMESVLAIRETAPGERCRLDVVFIGIEFEGEYEAIWKMLDADGKDCFENRPTLFNVEINCRYEG